MTYTRTKTNAELVSRYFRIAASEIMDDVEKEISPFVMISCRKSFPG